MKFIEEQPASGTDGESTVPVFKMGRSEVTVLRDLCREAMRKTPRTMDTHIFRSRVGNILRCFDRYVAGKAQEAPKSDLEKTFILTDLCMWEKNKQEGKSDMHAIIVFDEETGQNRMIAGGSKIRFVEGNITAPMTQEDYNNQPPQIIEE